MVHRPVPPIRTPKRKIHPVAIQPLATAPGVLDADRCWQFAQRLAVLIERIRAAKKESAVDEH